MVKQARTRLTRLEMDKLTPVDLMARRKEQKKLQNKRYKEKSGGSRTEQKQKLEGQQEELDRLRLKIKGLEADSAVLHDRIGDLEQQAERDKKCRRRAEDAADDLHHRLRQLYIAFYGDEKMLRWVPQYMKSPFAEHHAKSEADQIKAV